MLDEPLDFDRLNEQIDGVRRLDWVRQTMNEDFKIVYIDKWTGYIKENSFPLEVNLKIQAFLDAMNSAQISMNAMLDTIENLLAGVDPLDDRAFIKSLCCAQTRRRRVAFVAFRINNKKMSAGVKCVFFIFLF